ncbi:hypothetical protein GC167_03470 [bacterium]|nr:hypothetical protein [bacterium]
MTHPASILVPTDFSAASSKAAFLGADMALSSGAMLRLFHVVNADSARYLRAAGTRESTPEEALAALGARLEQQHQGLQIDLRTGAGSVAEQLIAETRDPACSMMVMTTHGTRGLRQNLFGADALRIAQGSAIPVLTVPDQSDESYRGKTLILPYSAHEAYAALVRTAARIAQWLDAQVVVFGIKKSGEVLSEQTRRNVVEAMDYLGSRQIQAREVLREASHFSVGFAGELLHFAREVDARWIGLMAEAADEHAYFAKTDRERLLNNEQGIGLFFSSG